MNSSLSPERATSTMKAEQKTELPAIPIQFMPVADLTTFSAEVAVTEGDLVYHFYPTDEVQKMPGAAKYWKDVFPQVLEQTAKSYFNADFPRLKAAYTEEKASWWLRAYGFGLVLDPHKLALRFCDVLDEALDAAIASSK